MFSHSIYGLILYILLFHIFFDSIYSLILYIFYILLFYIYSTYSLIPHFLLFHILSLWFHILSHLINSFILNILFIHMLSPLINSLILHILLIHRFSYSVYSRILFRRTTAENISRANSLSPSLLYSHPHTLHLPYKHIDIYDTVAEFQQSYSRQCFSLSLSLSYAHTLPALTLTHIHTNLWYSSPASLVQRQTLSLSLSRTHTLTIHSPTHTHASMVQ